MAGTTFQREFNQDVTTTLDYRTALSVKDPRFNAKGDGTSDDTTAITATITAAQPGQQVLFPRTSGHYKTTDAIAGKTGVDLIGQHRTVEIKQYTLGKPVFDLFDVSNITVQDLTLTGVSSKVYPGASAFRAGDSYLYSAGIWANGDNIRACRLFINNLVCGVFWSGYSSSLSALGGAARVGNVLDDVRVSAVDFGLLATSREAPIVRNLQGGYTLTSGSGNPPHLIYWSDTGAPSPSTCLHISDCHATASAGSFAYQFKSARSGFVHDMSADGCAGILSIVDLQDVVFSDFISRGDVVSGGTGSVYIQDAITTRCFFNNFSLEMPTSQRAIRFDGADNILSRPVIRSNRPSSVASDPDIYVLGTNHLIDRPTVFNLQSATGGTTVIYLVGGSGHIVRKPRLAGVRVGVRIDAGITGCLVDYESSSITAATAGFTANIQNNEPTTILPATAEPGVLLRSGLWYPVGATPGVSAVLGIAAVRATPFLVPNSVTVDQVGIEITSPGDSGAKFRIGIWSDDGTGKPATLVLDAGQVAADAIATPTIGSLSTVLTPGVYWIGGAVQNVVTTQPTVRTSTGRIGPVGGSATSNVSSADQIAISASGFTGAFSAIVGVNPSNVTPRVMLHFA